MRNLLLMFKIRMILVNVFLFQLKCFLLVLIGDN